MNSVSSQFSSRPDRTPNLQDRSAIVRLPLVEASPEVQTRVAAEMQFVRKRYDGSIRHFDEAQQRTKFVALSQRP